MCTVTASIISAVAGGLWQGYTQSRQAKIQASQAKANAKIADQNAQKLQDQAEQTAENNRINAESKRRQLMGRMARQQVNIAASGLTATGSAANALADSKVEMEKEMALDSYNNRQQVENILQRSTDQANQAAQYKQTARDYQKAGKWAWINAGLSTAFSLASTLYKPNSAAVTNAGGTGSAGGTASAPTAMGYVQKATNYVAQGQGLTWSGFHYSSPLYPGAGTSEGYISDAYKTAFGRDMLRF